MATILACDLGTRRTGVALGSDTDGTVVALDPLVSKNEEDLIAQLLSAIALRRIDVVVLGLPLLPGGKEGAQAVIVRRVGRALSETGVAVEYLDERYTTDPSKDLNSDVKAACQLLNTYLERRDLTKT